MGDSAPTTIGDSGPVSDGGSADGCSPTADDPLDDEGIDSNCDGADGKVGFDLYVNPTIGQDSNEGSPTLPKRSPAAALLMAAGTGGSVVLSSGELEVESIEAAGKWRLVGGYDKTFLGAPKRERTTFNVTNADGLRIAGSGVDGTLAHVQTVGAPATSEEQPSAYAIRATVERLHLDDASVKSGTVAQESVSASIAAIDPGQGGNPGWDGRTTDAFVALPTTTCASVLQPNWVSGSAGDTAYGTRGSGRSAGAGGPDGTPGTDGSNAPKPASLVDGFLRWGDGTSGLSDGKPGAGGAGAKPLASAYLSASGGSGGCPGAGGPAGKSGGGSIAIMLLNGELT